MAKCEILDDDVVVGRNEIAAIFKCSPRHITNYVEKGMPAIEKGRNFNYRVKECIFWAVQNGFLKIPIDIDADIDEEELPPNVRKDLADARIKEFKLREMNDEVVKKSKVVADATQVGIFIRERLMSIPDRVAGEFASEESPKEIIKTLKREFTNTLMDISSEFMETDTSE